MNVRFKYLYRDAGNFKNWGSVVFTNTSNLDVVTLEAKLTKMLIDQEFFVAEDVAVPDLHFEQDVIELDHEWHQFHSFEECESEPTDEQKRDIAKFIDAFRSQIKDHAGYSQTSSTPSPTAKSTTHCSQCGQPYKPPPQP